ncbi:serine/threonine protein phosphatase [Bordetella avium]|nr:serine/threonine protein phosphatase [Bordetella avium]AZY54319.1 serine/threonine protein phosphatase [Bordetella avium]RIQ12884.1 serine/threonine protein phosphatase [Bordetella avium]RIQ19403.1 serine/threonine protein phosphatase [Bordetella avium]RIQ32100.1 serine/threonine protein phosphatase [Bordetella avium]
MLRMVFILNIIVQYRCPQHRQSALILLMSSCVSLGPDGVLRLPRNLRGRDFAVGDIHGHFCRLQQALDEMGFESGRDRLFSVGDLIDRGPDSLAAAVWLQAPWFFAVQGNHEDMAIRHVRSGMLDQNIWRRNGGGWFLDLPPERQRVLAQCYEALPVLIEVATQAGPVVLVHADSPVQDWSCLVALTPEDRARAQWSRERLQTHNTAGVANVRAVVTGHTVVPEPLVLGNVYHIDTAGWQDEGYFTLLALDSLSAWPRPVRVGGS